MANQPLGRYVDGDVGFFGLADVVLTNYSEFFDPDNNPIKQDETTQTHEIIELIFFPKQAQETKQKQR